MTDIPADIIIFVVVVVGISTAGIGGSIVIILIIFTVATRNSIGTTNTGTPRRVDIDIDGQCTSSIDSSRSSIMNCALYDLLGQRLLWNSRITRMQINGRQCQRRRYMKQFMQ